VENAIILLISFCNKPEDAAKKEVNDPIIVIMNKAVELYSNIGDDLISKYKPAVTRVAAWISDETGVG
jgi:hypothetical protein